MALTAWGKKEVPTGKRKPIALPCRRGVPPKKGGGTPPCGKKEKDTGDREGGTSGTRTHNIQRAVSYTKIEVGRGDQENG